MDPQVLPPTPGNDTDRNPPDAPPPFSGPPARFQSLQIFFGPAGLRAGWSLLLLWCIYEFLLYFFGTIAVLLDPALIDFKFTPGNAVIAELVPFLALLAAGTFLARLESRRILDYHMQDPRPIVHLLSGAAFGFLALSLLVAALAAGGWLHFGHVAPLNLPLLRFFLLWTLAFLLTGLFEEGAFRGFVQFTLTRGLNFWWALAAQALICLDLALRVHGRVIFGVYAMVALGLVPCLVLQLKRVPGSSFWQAAWVSSTAFGAFHTGNTGENALGIFAAAAIGFVFCASLRLTGSIWWAIGCHAAWDWAETFFYGTANSGFGSQGSLLSTAPAGNPIWSGGTDGPEGSLLIIPILLLLLAALFAVYARRKPATST